MAPSMSRSADENQRHGELKSSRSVSSQKIFVNIKPFDDNNGSSSPWPLTKLPDEFLLALANQLSINEIEDINALQALALTCRKMSDIVFDKTRLGKAFQAEIPEVIKLLPKFKWNTIRQAVLFKKFQQKAQRLITDVMEPEINAPDRWDFNLPIDATKGWKNVVEIGLLLHAKTHPNKMMLGDVSPHDKETIYTFTSGEKLVLMYSALLWQETYFSWLPLEDKTVPTFIEVGGVSLFATLRSAFIMEGPELLLNMCRSPRTTPRDIGDAKDMFEIAKHHHAWWEEQASPGLSEERWLGNQVERNLKKWAGAGNIDLSQSLKDVGVGEQGRLSLLKCVKAWSTTNWRDLPWTDNFHM